jgi:hypothetical protein
MLNIFKNRIHYLINIGTFVFILSISFVSYSWACPNLAGDYVCPDDVKGQLLVSVQQMKKARITTFILKEEGQKDEEYIADNKSRTVKDGSSEITTRSKCDGSTTLITTFNATDSDTDMKLEGTHHVQLDSNKSLQTTTKGKATIGNQVLPISEFTVCPIKTK